MTDPRLPAWLRPANRVVKGLHRLGIPLGTIHVLTIPGRTTGEPRSTPVSPLTVDGRRYVISGLADSSWAKNAHLEDGDLVAAETPAAAGATPPVTRHGEADRPTAEGDA